MTSVPHSGAKSVTPGGSVAGGAGWRCFHCDETFTDRRCAAAHFGADEDAAPACQIKGSEVGLVEALRRAEKDAGDAWFAIHNESTEAAQAYYAQNSRHREQMVAVEQAGYDRGLADAKAHPETLGLTADAPDLLEALREARDALHQHYVDWDGEPEDAVSLQLARAKCDAAIAKATAGETRNAEPIHRRDGDEG
ncbi:hypothetical protein HNP32_001689 [Brevundimonas bullata]|uniref:Uncharacterized protein n=1 Tax=Brevundimonas bullata TaxID=13160 RepID=A0A7W7IP54_9CAUL|nr:hypothetical protein [Brevundimonas bullata]MBB4797965.1 hypothetical protein [Brevundimonas bullata]MBB6382924.1 hypothetical protein [Brevundimonas bullata]